MKIVLNLEPLGYSRNAIEIWKSSGFEYVDVGNLRPHEFHLVDTVIVRLQKFIDSSVLDHYGNMKSLITATTGLDHIDTEYLKKRSISLFSLREHKAFLDTIPSTAEHTWALLMSLIRNIPSAHKHVEKGDWSRDEFRGLELSGKTIGIIGLGRTGSKVARYATAFGMNVLYYDPYVKNSDYKEVNTIISLFQLADIVSLHVHLSYETKGMINNDVLKEIRNPVFLVNTSRGKVVDESSVIKYLRTGQIKGYATDVLGTELEQINESPIYSGLNENLNIIVTPHIGGATWDAMWKCEEFMCKLVCGPEQI